MVLRFYTPVVESHLFFTLKKVNFQKTYSIINISGV